MSAQLDYLGVRPKGAEVRIDGIWYKQGLHGLIFRWNDEEWVKSNLTRKEFEKAFRGGLRTNQWRRSSIHMGGSRSSRVVGMKELSGCDAKGSRS